MQDIMMTVTATTYFVSLLSMIDIGLTYYILWFNQKLYPKDPKFKELNIVAAFIMRLTNNGPWGLLLGNILSQTLIWGGVYFLVHYIDPLQAVVATNLMLGALFTVIWIHMYSIGQLQRMKHSKEIVLEELG